MSKLGRKNIRKELKTGEEAKKKPQHQTGKATSREKVNGGKTHDVMRGGNAIKKIN